VAISGDIARAIIKGPMCQERSSRWRRGRRDAGRRIVGLNSRRRQSRVVDRHFVEQPVEEAGVNVTVANVNMVRASTGSDGTKGLCARPNLGSIDVDPCIAGFRGQRDVAPSVGGTFGRRRQRDDGRINVDHGVAEGCKLKVSQAAIRSADNRLEVVDDGRGVDPGLDR
jgi:hypothetical protein